MWSLGEVKSFFGNEPWQNRIAYIFMLLLAVLYLLSQIAMAIMWLAGGAQLDSV
jgi:hypothetical protein